MGRATLEAWLMPLENLSTALSLSVSHLISLVLKNCNFGSVNKQNIHENNGVATKLLLPSPLCLTNCFTISIL
jgi:hypothetical protein